MSSPGWDGIDEVQSAEMVRIAHAISQTPHHFPDIPITPQLLALLIAQDGQFAATLARLKGTLSLLVEVRCITWPGGINDEIALTPEVANELNPRGPE